MNFEAALALGLSLALAAVSFALKAWAFRYEGKGAIASAMGTVTVMFLLRMTTLGIASWVVADKGLSVGIFVAVFLGIYVVQQALEMAWVIKRQNQGKTV